MNDNYELAEKIATAKIKSMSFSELEDYVYENFMHNLLVMEQDELARFAQWYGVEYGKE